MRFQLLDRITVLEPRERIAAVKNLTMAEEYLADHFPGFPVMPGVMMLETLVQTGAWLMRVSEDFRFSGVLLRQARGLKFNNFVAPGRSLEVELNVHKWDGNECTFKAAGTVDGKSAVSARITLQQFNLADGDSKLAESDARLIAWSKETFDLIKPPESTAAAPA